MDLGNLVSIYGKPIIRECESCQGNGCEICHGFGYIARTANKNVSYSFTYPLYVDIKKRDEVALLRNFLVIGISCIALFSVVISYIINFSHNG